jgi:hypothetical protein
MFFLAIRPWRSSENRALLFNRDSLYACKVLRSMQSSENRRNYRYLPESRIFKVPGDTVPEALSLMDPLLDITH